MCVHRTHGDQTGFKGLLSFLWDLESTWKNSLLVRNVETVEVFHEVNLRILSSRDLFLLTYGVRCIACKSDQSLVYWYIK